MRDVITGRAHGTHKHQFQSDGVCGRKIKAWCDSSQLTVVLELPEIDGVSTAFVSGEHIAQMVIAALGFATGSGYSVEMIQVLPENGPPAVIGVRPTMGDDSRQTLGLTPHNPTFSDVLALARRNLFFRMALLDYVRAITQSGDCPTYCYRAIEVIRSAFATSKKDGWRLMHLALETEEGTITRRVKNYADPVRHGNWVTAKPTTGSERYDMLLLTREILTKYLEWEKRQAAAGDLTANPTA